MGINTPSYRGFRFSVEIISQCVWLYHRFPLSLREVEEMMLQRGVVVSHETARHSAVPRVHLPVSLTGPAPSGSTDAPRRCQGCSTLPGISRIRLPPASPDRCDGQEAKVSHLRSTSDASWRT